MHCTFLSFVSTYFVITTLLRHFNEYILTHGTKKSGRLPNFSHIKNGNVEVFWPHKSLCQLIHIHMEEDSVKVMSEWINCMISRQTLWSLNYGSTRAWFVEENIYISNWISFIVLNM